MQISFRRPRRQKERLKKLTKLIFKPRNRGTMRHEIVTVFCYSLPHLFKSMRHILQEKAAERAAFKEIRAVSSSTSKRAAADARQVMHAACSSGANCSFKVMSAQVARREKRRNEGETCEHGIHRCRICFPIDSRK